METAKQKAIREAYGEHWNEVKEHVDENGWVESGAYYNNEPIDFEMFKIELDTETYTRPFGAFTETVEINRPKSLQGVEDNNGWIKIESEDDLPKEIGDGFFIILEKQVYQSTLRADYRFEINQDAIFNYTMVTHYQPITKPNPPLF